MTFPGVFKDHILPDQLEVISLSFLVDSMLRRRGGVAPNIAYTLALLGYKPRILATVGIDFVEYRTWLESIGVDTSDMHVVPEKYTASFFVTTDQNNSQIASFYPGAMAHASDLSLRNLESAFPDLVVISPNAPDAMVQYVVECKDLGINYLYDPSQQIVRFDRDVLQEGVEGALALFANEYEFGLIMNKTGMSKEDILDCVQFMVITKGEKGSTIYHRKDEIDISAVTPKKVLDPTGGGDAFRGGFLTGYSRGWDWKICGQLGALAATYCLESDGPQGQEYSRNEFIKRFRQQFDDNGCLDQLLE
jgi:adenosine kinase